MKKSFIVAALIVGLFVINSHASGSGLLNVPTGPGSQLPTADYGGVERSTVSFSSANVLCFVGGGSFAGAVVSSPSLGVAQQENYIECRDTGSLIAGAQSGLNPGVPGDDYLRSDTFVRIYVGTGTMTGQGLGFANAQFGTVVTLPKPIRVFAGLACKASQATFNVITFLYTKFGR